MTKYTRCPSCSYVLDLNMLSADGIVREEDRLNCPACMSVLRVESVDEKGVGSFAVEIPANPENIQRGQALAKQQVDQTPVYVDRTTRPTIGSDELARQRAAEAAAAEAARERVQAEAAAPKPYKPGDLWDEDTVEDLPQGEAAAASEVDL